MSLRPAIFKTYVEKSATVLDPRQILTYWVKSTTLLFTLLFLKSHFSFFFLSLLPSVSREGLVRM